MLWVCVILLPGACSAVLYFFTLSHKRHYFGNKVIEYKMYILIFCTQFSVAFLILRRTERDMIVNLY